MTKEIIPIIEIIQKNEGTTQEIINQTINFLSTKTFEEQEAVQLAAYGRFLKNLGTEIENHASDEALRYLSENEMNMNISDMNVSYREYFEDVQVEEDHTLNKYKEIEADLKEQLSDIKQSIKNRKEQLKHEKKIISILKNKSLAIRSK